MESHCEILSNCAKRTYFPLTFVDSLQPFTSLDIVSIKFSCFAGFLSSHVLIRPLCRTVLLNFPFDFLCPIKRQCVILHSLLGNLMLWHGFIIPMFHLAVTHHSDFWKHSQLCPGNLHGII